MNPSENKPSENKPSEKKTEPIKIIEKKSVENKKDPASDLATNSMPMALADKIKHLENMTSLQNMQEKPEESDLDGIGDLDIFQDAPEKESTANKSNSVETAKSSSKRADLETVHEEVSAPTAVLDKAASKKIATNKQNNSGTLSASAKTQEEAIAILKMGKTLIQSTLPTLNLGNQVFSSPIRIENCSIEHFIANGSEFEAAVTIENSTISKEFRLNGDRPANFHDGLILKKVNLSSNVILSQASIGKLTISDCRATAPIYMTETNYESGVFISNSQLHSIISNNSRVYGIINITNTRFQDGISWENSSFNESCILSSVQMQKLSFQKSSFQRKLELLSCNFEKPCNFSAITCQGTHTILGCIFQGVVSFQKSQFYQDINIRKTDFFQDASFAKIISNGTFCLEECTWNSIADFSSSSLYGLRLLKNNFGGSTNFQESIITGSSVVLETQFKEQLNLCRSIWFQKLDLRETKFLGNISFAGLIADYVLLKHNQIAGKLASEKQKDYATQYEEYLLLKQIFHRQERYEEEDWAYLQAKRASRKKNKINFSAPWRVFTKPFDFIFLDMGFGYGTKPANLILLGLAVILVFAMMYSIMQNSGYDFGNVVAIPKITENQPLQKYLQNVAISFVSFLPTGVAQWPMYGKDYSVWNAVKHIPQMAMILENLFGWFILFLFLFGCFRKSSR